MGVPIDEIAERLWRADHAGHDIVASEDGTIDIARSLPCQARETLE
jgi:hypothetical protein